MCQRAADEVLAAADSEKSLEARTPPRGPVSLHELRLLLFRYPEKRKVSHPQVFRPKHYGVRLRCKLQVRWCDGVLARDVGKDDRTLAEPERSILEHWYRTEVELFGAFCSARPRTFQ